MKLVGWLAIAAAVAVAGLGASFLLLRPGGLERFEREARARAEAARPNPASAGMFRATVCAESPCLLVEAGGLAFLVGAGKGAAEGLALRGLMRSDLDGVLLGDIGLASVEGLPGLRRASLAAGREAPLPVFAPDGALPAIDGANLMLTETTNDTARLTLGIEGEDEGLAGKVVFDSGVVAIRAFPTGEGNSRVYRFDFSGKSLLVAGCAASVQDLVAAARGAQQASAVIAAASPKLLEIERRSARKTGAPLRTEGATCATTDDALAAAREARLSATMLAPLVPALSESEGAWTESATFPANAGVVAAGPGAVLDLTAAKPSILQPE